MGIPYAAGHLLVGAILFFNSKENSHDLLEDKDEN